jgi:DNA-binding MarR family transcriptional regulator
MKKEKLDKATLEGCLQCACLSFRQASRTVTQFFDNALASVGLLSTQLPVLILLGLYSPLTITRLAKLLVMDRTTLTKNLKVLQAKSYIKAITAKDKRKTLLTLTSKGEAMLAKAHPLWQRAQKRIVEGLGPDQWETVRERLGQVIEIAGNR